MKKINYDIFFYISYSKKLRISKTSDKLSNEDYSFISDKIKKFDINSNISKNEIEIIPNDEDESFRIYDNHFKDYLILEDDEDKRKRFIIDNYNKFYKDYLFQINLYNQNNKLIHLYSNLIFHSKKYMNDLIDYYISIYNEDDEDYEILDKMIIFENNNLKMKNDLLILKKLELI